MLSHARPRYCLVVFVSEGVLLLGAGLYQERWPYLGTLGLGPTEDAPGTTIVQLNVGYQSRGFGVY